MFEASLVITQPAVNVGRIADEKLMPIFTVFRFLTGLYRAAGNGFLQGSNNEKQCGQK